MTLQNKLTESIYKDEQVRLKKNIRQDSKKKGLLKPARKIPQESDEGYIEYKWKLCDFQGGQRRWDKLVSQMIFRFLQGEGKAVYNIGYTDTGEPVGLEYQKMVESLANFGNIVEEAGGIIKSIKIFQANEEKYYCVNIFLEKNLTDQEVAFDAELLHLDSD